MENDGKNDFDCVFSTDWAGLLPIPVLFYTNNDWSICLVELVQLEHEYVFVCDQIA